MTLTKHSHKQILLSAASQNRRDISPNSHYIFKSHSSSFLFLCCFVHPAVAPHHLPNLRVCSYQSKLLDVWHCGLNTQSAYFKHRLMAFLLDNDDWFCFPSFVKAQHTPRILTSPSDTSMHPSVPLDLAHSPALNNELCYTQNNLLINNNLRDYTSQLIVMQHQEQQW